MASGTLTLSTQSVDYGGGRGGMSMTNTINWSTSGNTLTLSNGGRSGGNYWTLYNATGASDYLVVLKVQVNYGSGWTTISEQSAYIGTVAQGGLRIDTKSEEFLNNLGSYTLTGNCSLRALYYATYAPVPTADYPYAFPNESYSEASQTPVVVDVVVAPDTPTITNISSTHNSITCDYGTTSFGTPSSGAIRLYCTPPNGQGGIAAQKTTTGTTTTTFTDYRRLFTNIDIKGNTQYQLYSLADNGSATSRSSDVSITTLPSETAVSIASVSDTSILMHFSAPSNGHAYDQYLEYSKDGGTTWHIYAISNTSLVFDGNALIDNLRSNTEYTILTRTRTSAGITSGATLTVTTSTNSNPVISSFQSTQGNTGMDPVQLYYMLDGFSGYPVPATETITITDSNGATVYTKTSSKSGDIRERVYVSDNIVYNEQYSLTCRIENSTGYDEETITGSTCLAPLNVVYDPTTKKVIITYDPGEGYCGTKINYRLDDGSITQFMAVPSGTTATQTYELDVSQLTDGSHTLVFSNLRYDTSDPYSPYLYAPNFTFNVGVRTYGSKDTNDLAEKLIKVYAPVSGLSKSLKVYAAVAKQGTVGVIGTIRSGGDGNVTAFDADTFWAKFITSSAYDINKTVSYIEVSAPPIPQLTTFAFIHYTDNTYDDFSDVTTAALAEYGITYSLVQVAGSDYIDLTPISGTVYATKLIHEK